MMDLLIAGNLLFTLPLVLLAASILAVAVRAVVSAWSKDQTPAAAMTWLFHLGLFAFVFGLLSQAISLYQMMAAIESVGAVSPAIVAGGLKVSFIAPLFGVIVFAVALLLRLGLQFFSVRIADVA